MHIPDGFLDWQIATALYGASASVLAISAARTKKTLGDERIPLLGVLAAAIFAAQMLNWPIPGGTSAHFVGGGLAAILLGPSAAAVALSSVLTIQCLVFGDGGITALGANIWNMAVVDVFSAYFVYKLLGNRSPSLAAFLAGWVGITLAAVSTGLEIGMSSTFTYQVEVTVPVMFTWHGILGIVEGVITASVVAYVVKSRPDLVSGKISSRRLGV